MHRQPYDNELLAADVGFLPWEGRDYRHNPVIVGRRVHTLIIGESHYDPGRPESELNVKKDLPTFTRRNVLFRMANASTADSFWRRIERVFGVGDRPDDIRQFWESVAFCNMVQDLLKNSQVRDLTPYWPRACRCLAPLLDALQPDVAIVLGAATWRGIDGKNSRNTGRKVGSAVPRKFENSDSRYDEIWMLSANRRDVPAIHIAHPMYKGGFNPEEWRPVVEGFLAMDGPRTLPSAT